MQRSTERILTTHVGSLVRTPEIMRGMKARALNQPYDEARLSEDIRRGVAEVVRQQVDVGVDVPSNGEFSRGGFRSYINERLAGIEPRPLDASENPFDLIDTLEQRQFPEFFKQYYQHYRYLWMHPGVDISDLPNVPGNFGYRYQVTGPIAYQGQAAIRREIDDFKAALDGLLVADAFMPADIPTSRWGDTQVLDIYPTEDAYYEAVADALREEYLTIVEAGLILQIDLATLNPGGSVSRPTPAGARAGDVARALEQRVEVINYALRDIPEDKVRYHHCWGSMNHPHTQDASLKSFVHLMLRINAQAYSIEAANPRHEHEWMLWKDVKLPDGKLLIPGIVSHQTNVVEHPELVAWRIKNFASVVGKENVIAGTDCGFSQFWDAIRVHPTVQWAKLKALADGAALASAELW